MPRHGYSEEIPNCTPPQTARESGIAMCERTDADQRTHWAKRGDTTKARKGGQTASPVRLLNGFGGAIVRVVRSSDNTFLQVAIMEKPGRNRPVWSAKLRVSVARGRSKNLCHREETRNPRVRGTPENSRFLHWWSH